MITEYLLRQVAGALETAAEKTAVSHTLAGAVLSADRTSITVTTMPTADATWYPFTVLDLGSGVARVVRSADVDGKAITWQRPLLDTEAASATPTISTSPLAGAEVVIGGGSDFKPRRCIVWCTSSRHSSFTVGHDYGSRQERPSGIVAVRWAFVPEADEDFSTEGLAFLRMVEQVCEILEYSLPDDAVVALPEEVDHTWWRERQPGSDDPVFYYGADVRFALEMLR